MQTDGYFASHPHYEDYFGKELSDEDRALDQIILSLDFSSSDIYTPIPYSEAQRQAHRTFVATENL